MIFSDDTDAPDAIEGTAAPNVPDAPRTALAVACANTNAMQSPRVDRYPNRWRKGQSGNPNGRPMGSRHRATLLAENLLDGQTEELLQKTIDLALAGDPTAMRLCIERIIAPRRDRPLSFVSIRRRPQGRGLNFVAPLTPPGKQHFRVLPVSAQLSSSMAAARQSSLPDGRVVWRGRGRAKPWDRRR